ncbi:SRPBCC family protein [uncultured Tateyamaria sp.]|uniref:SRPBCC family protein n=1 Tax=uncultured Tateyamaria sp. TaxID=455651 RepID=UPI002623866B|nr:SRPBCC family protein [uncultured Tateyamaria sp.]
MITRRDILMGSGAALAASIAGQAFALGSRFPHDQRTIGNFRVDTVTSAALDQTFALQLDAAPSSVWELVGSHTRLNEWFPGIARAYVLEPTSTNRSFAPLFTRQCEFEGDLLTEDIPYDNGRDAYAYSINKDRSNVLVPISDHLGVFTVEPVQGGKSLLVWRQYWRKGLMGQVGVPRLVNRYMKPGLQNLVDRYGGGFVAVS